MIERVGPIELLALQRDPLGLHAGLERVPLQTGIGEVVLDRPAFLPLVLIAAAPAIGQQRAALGSVRIARIGSLIFQRDAVFEQLRIRTQKHILIGYFEIVVRKTVVSGKSVSESLVIGCR